MAKDNCKKEDCKWRLAPGIDYFCDHPDCDESKLENIEFIDPLKEEIEKLKTLNQEQIEYGEKYAEEWRIVCAACRWPDGHVILGIRHFSPDMLLSAKLQGYNPRDCIEEGFVNQYGKYLTREEAREIAVKQGQYRPFEPASKIALYSEDLY